MDITTNAAYAKKYVQNRSMNSSHLTRTYMAGLPITTTTTTSMQGQLHTQDVLTGWRMATACFLTEFSLNYPQNCS